ncbi:hypothetical protein FN846DRAFT_33666 [Sphaerosporella brunnea]|uniref:Uncharacterized protein n=1 Tax=Sphaerosporella brunnea TaxID=1250544 RepID=A0A5J5EUW7_9PEZI|nr:hypothetical protein FN846DRAFT_33666 [Sphaerosporella brunnea]
MYLPHFLQPTAKFRLAALCLMMVYCRIFQLRASAFSPPENATRCCAPKYAVPMRQVRRYRAAYSLASGYLGNWCNSPHSLEASKGEAQKIFKLHTDWGDLRLGTYIINCGGSSIKECLAFGK